MPRVLATQSHVVHGYVGNKAATFPLQCLGWDVDCCNTVQFSNHTGYGLDKVFGNVINEQDLEKVLDGVMSNFPSDYDAFLSGYLPNKKSVACMGEFYAKFKQLNPESIWLLDPVMGDEGVLYVDENVVPEYKKLVLNSNIGVDVVTPNQFELEVLCGKPIKNFQELKSALEQLHNRVPVIVVTSLIQSVFNDPDHIYCVASVRNQKPVTFRVPLIASYFTGVGDLFSALLIDRISKFKKSSDNFATVNMQTFANDITEVLNIIQNVLNVTKKYAPKDIKSVMGVAEKMKVFELRIVESRDIYLSEDKTNYRNFQIDIET